MPSANAVVLCHISHGCFVLRSSTPIWDWPGLMRCRLGYLEQKYLNQLSSTVRALCLTWCICIPLNIAWLAMVPVPTADSHCPCRWLSPSGTWVRCIGLNMVVFSRTARAQEWEPCSLQLLPGHHAACRPGSFAPLCFSEPAGLVEICDVCEQKHGCSPLFTENLAPCLLLLSCRSLRTCSWCC